MNLQPVPSLFEHSGAEPLGEVSAWLTGTLLGDLATGICVIAIAVVGLTMMSGRLPVRDGLRVVIGCFILLGAPVIAAELMGSSEPGEPLIRLPVSEAMPDRRGDLPPASHDPYAGASLARD